MTRLHPDDIQEIAVRVVALLGAPSAVDPQKVAELTLKERQAFWRGQRIKEKRG